LILKITDNVKITYIILIQTGFLMDTHDSNLKKKNVEHVSNNPQKTIHAS